MTMVTAAATLLNKAVAQRCSVKKLLLEISQENTCTRVSCARETTMSDCF